MGLEQYTVKSGQPCWDCKKACGGCSWSDRGEPVDGWTAKPMRRRTGNSKGETVMMDTYIIKACPLFEPDEPRKKPMRGHAK